MLITLEILPMCHDKRKDLLTLSILQWQEYDGYGLNMLYNKNRI